MKQWISLCTEASVHATINSTECQQLIRLRHAQILLVSNKFMSLDPAYFSRIKLCLSPSEWQHKKQNEIK